MRIFFCFILLVFFSPVLITGPVSAMKTEGIATQVSAGLGVESLIYEEQLSETSLQSNADVSNIVFRIEGVKRWENIFVGIDGAVPVVNFDSQEEWSVNGTLTQTDSLSYGITQLATFIGYPVAPLFNPYLGLRSTWFNQERSDFREPDGTLISSSRITESIKAHYISLGLRGDLPISKDWVIFYDAEYNFPYYSKVNNDGLPGWETTNINGYSWKVSGELLYILKEKLSLGLLLSASRIHWKGDDWQIYNNGQIKWPENDTYIVNLFFSFNWGF